MKKTITFLLATIMLMSLFTACGGNNDVSQTDTQGTNTEKQEESVQEEIRELNLEEVYAAIVADVSEGQEELIMFPESNPDLIESFYPGLSELSLNQQVLYMPPIAGWASEIMLVEAADESNADKAAEIFQTRIDKGADTTDYPETAAAWAVNATVQRYGNYVAMIALPEGYAIPEDVFALEPIANTPDADVQNKDENEVEDEEKPVNAGGDYPKFYLEKAKELAAENENIRFSLVNIDEDDIPELVADYPGFNLSVYTYNRTSGELVTLIDQWGYGAAGNPGYDYDPGRNVIRNISTQQAGSQTYYTYYMIDNGEILTYFGVDIYEMHYEDKNGNGILDSDESYSEEPVAYIVDGKEVSEEEFKSYCITGDYKPLMGEKMVDELEADFL